jgi:GxxExxY protein
MNYNVITQQIIGCAIKVYKALGPGLLESAYQTCLVHELKKSNLANRHEVSLPILYDGLKLDHGYRIDILVENKIVIELKSVDSITDIHKAQVIKYIKLGNYKLGLLINFNVKLLTHGINRFIN